MSARHESEQPTRHGLWNAQDVARFLKCSPSAVYRWAELGQIPCRRIGTLLRFKPEEVEAWLDRNASASILPFPRHAGWRE
jgi:excisionase family DNA binding protein